MALIPHGHASYRGFYPVLWSDWSDPLYMRESPSFSARSLKVIRRYELVHYISGYRDNGGYRWFFCRAWQYGTRNESWWEVGWIPAVRLDDRRQVLKALGRAGCLSGLFSPTSRCIQMRPDTDTYNYAGDYIGKARDWFDKYFSYARCGDDDRYVCTLLKEESVSAHAVPYPGQENVVKAWAVCHDRYWWIVGGDRWGGVYPETGYFFESGITGTDVNPPWLKRWN